MSWTITPGGVTAGTDTSAETAAPSGVTAGDLLVLVVIVEVAGTITTPTGWTARPAAQDGSSTTRLAMFERIADGGADDTPTVTVFASVTAWQTVILRITGQAASSPFDASNTATSTSGGTPALPTVTTAEAGELLVAALSTPNADVTGHPSGWTIRAESEPVANTLAVWTREAGPAGSYGGETATIEFSTASTRLIATYRPAGGGGTTRGIPFGTRGTAFGGGRTFRGLIG